MTIQCVWLSSQTQTYKYANRLSRAPKISTERFCIENIIIRLYLCVQNSSRSYFWLYPFSFCSIVQNLIRRQKINICKWECLRYKFIMCHDCAVCILLHTCRAESCSPVRSSIECVFLIIKSCSHT